MSAFTRLGGGSPKADIVHFFDRFSYMMASLKSDATVSHLHATYILVNKINACANLNNITIKVPF